MDLSPKLGLTIENYLEVLVRSRLDLGPDMGLAIAKQLGIDQKRWKFGVAKWKAVVDAHSSDPEIPALYTAIVARVDGPQVPEMDILEYADVCVRVQAGEPFIAVMKDQGVDPIVFSRFSTATAERLNSDARLNALYTAAHRKASAYRGRATRVNKRVPARDEKRTQNKQRVGLPGHIRGRKCPSCGAFKMTGHAHVYISCDFCGALFDYDVTLRNRKEASLAADAFMDLVAVVDFEELPADPDLADAHRREARTWMQRGLVQLFPNDHPPRVREAEYLKAYVEQWLVPTQIAWMNDPTTIKSAEILSRHQRLFLGKQPTIDNVKPLFEATRSHVENQARIAEREGLFAAHPDRLDTERFLRFSRSASLAAIIGSMSDPDAEALIDLAGLRCEMIAPPSTVLANAGCASCGCELTLVEGAQRAVCVDCGVVVDASDRRSCRACGAVLEGGANSWRSCGYCQTRWEAVC